LHGFEIFPDTADALNAALPRDTAFRCHRYPGVCSKGTLYLFLIIFEHDTSINFYFNQERSALNPFAAPVVVIVNNYTFSQT
jgi:hypothetical protein